LRVWVWGRVELCPCAEQSTHAGTARGKTDTATYGHTYRENKQGGREKSEIRKPGRFTHIHTHETDTQREKESVVKSNRE
jgi:hypothetical protein